MDIGMDRLSTWAAVVLIILMVTPVGFFVGRATADIELPFLPAVAADVGEDGADAREEYYRGLWDACNALGRGQAFCNRAIDVSVEQGWYEQPSQGWTWPRTGSQ